MQPVDPERHPILNTPYESPARHWGLDERFRATNDLRDGRRPSGAYMSVPKPKSGAVRDASAESVGPHPRINLIRDEVGRWRAAGYPGVRRLTRELLEHWADPNHEPRPFFCQREAVETLIWLLEAAPATPGFRGIRDELTDVNRKRNEGIERLAVKMATGTGKTRVMAMIILWLTLRRRGRADFLVVVPNLTVKDRLSELDPASGAALYKSLMPPHGTPPIGRMHVTVLNFQAFQRRSALAVDGSDDLPSGTAKRWMKGHQEAEPEHWTETPETMLDRLLRAHRGAKEIVVLNDEAHHCYAPDEPRKKVDKDTRDFERAAALWFNGLRTLRDTGRLGCVFDLSATPMYIRRPVDLDYELFPWTVTDYPLIDAVEAGLTKIPRVPVSDDTDKEEPVYRNTFAHTKPNALKSDDMHPQVVNLLESMHADYERLAASYAAVPGTITPVMIVVANTISNANALFRHIAGYRDGQGRWHPGAYDAFSNVKPDGSGPVAHPPTMLAHSGLGEPEDGGGADRVAGIQKDFHSPDENASKQELNHHIRRMFNTVGRPGGPGERIKCVVSVSMLTEGWDVRTVTHIFGFRAFTSQLLCEQVAGRALRRTGFPGAGDELLEPEYARIFGVPFNFMLGSEDPPPAPPAQTWKVETVPGKKPCRIEFPNVAAYALDPPDLRCALDPDRVDPYEVTAAHVPSETVSAGLVGGEAIDRTIPKRRQAIVYRIAGQAVRHFCENRKDARRRVLFASMLRAVEDWLDHPSVACTNHELLVHPPHIANVPLQIARACVETDDGKPRIRPVFADELERNLPRAIDTSDVSFETSLKLRYPVDPEEVAGNSELNRAACHSEPEQLLAVELDRHPGILAWARNFRLGWRIPWLDRNAGAWRHYEPDFVARTADGPRHLVIEFKGRTDEDAERKRDAVLNWWLPAVNGSEACPGRWEYLFIDDRSDIVRQLDEATGA